MQVLKAISNLDARFAQERMYINACNQCGPMRRTSSYSPLNKDQESQEIAGKGLMSFSLPGVMHLNSQFNTRSPPPSCTWTVSEVSACRPHSADRRAHAASLPRRGSVAGAPAAVAGVGEAGGEGAGLRLPYGLLRCEGEQLAAAVALVPHQALRGGGARLRQQAAGV